MDYKRQYDLLMEKAKQRGTVEGYKERHHIIPRCMGGSNKKENLVELTAREHYVAHRLLYMHHRTPSMLYAWVAMTRKNRYHERTITAREYEKLREAYAETPRSEEHKKKISESRKKVTPTKEQLDALRAIAVARKGTTRTFTDEWKKNIARGQTGRIHTEETKQKMSLAKKGKPKSEETKKRMVEAWKLRKQKRNESLI